MGKGSKDKGRQAGKDRGSKPSTRTSKSKDGHRDKSSKAPYKHKRDADWDEEDRKLIAQLEVSL